MLHSRRRVLALVLSVVIATLRAADPVKPPNVQ